MDFHVIKLHFVSPLHISKGAEDYSESDDLVHSDTLKSALFVSYYQLFQDMDSGFFDKFMLSSAFPFFGETLFLPKPFIRLTLNIKEENPSNIKKLKKLQWLDKTLFEKCIHNEKADISADNFSKNGKFVSFNFNKEYSPKIYTKEEQARVKVNYQTDNEPFALERIYFEKNAGLYVLVQCKEDFLHQKLLPAFRLLGENGLGSYKTTGNGQFEPVLEKPTALRVPQNSDYLLNLSLYCPSQQEAENHLQLNKSSYQLLKRGGYIANPEDTSKMSWRKKSVYMFQEGSVFKGNHLKGKLADLKPDGLPHPIYREGRPVFIPVVKPND